jgi:hypothetical protein
MNETTLVVLITSVILDRPTCLLCLAAKVGVDKLAVVRAMERIGETIQIHMANDERCRACGSTLGPVYLMKRHDRTGSAGAVASVEGLGDAPSPPVTRQRAGTHAADDASHH